ncbi:HD domain protein, metal dependent phosphohydrolase [Desulfamplus magnetovallimortis]|uniref:5'-deoxynucleotidase n=1 Tax=Desulfamplus magnetovallimortis TaxID=1246637 RepID=A0A1W1H4R6_9BACT|nr:HD domain-containing protein [Desulfamplus magnetovallimortis]SLM27375.1 HD domain protein, metal dependent phosphohydrolase [Desulfamplus magnetovallimortis]
MKRVVDFLFETNILKELPRSGYTFLGTGRESVAEHIFMTTMICFVISRMEPEVDREKLITMALVHDLPEARTGDLNYVQKQYVRPLEDKAMADMSKGLDFGDELKSLLDEFNESSSKEARLARDADQLSFMMELKKQHDIGALSPEKWLPFIENRLQTDTGRKIAGSIMASSWDDWWFANYSEPLPAGKNT